MKVMEKYFLLEGQPAVHRAARRKTFLLYGLGGMGKTQLAVAFAREHHDKFSAVLWLDGSSIDRLKQSFVAIASEMPQKELTADVMESLQADRIDADVIVRGVLRWLSLPSNKHWLLIVDNVDRDWNAKELDSLAFNPREYLPQADHGSILVTSRLAGIADDYEAELHVDRVDDAQARSMLDNNACRDLEDAQVVIDKLDRLPLALTQAGAYLRQTNMSVPTYIKHYDSTWKDLMEDQGHYFKREFGDRGSILTTWMISYKQVASESEGAANLLKLWGFLDCKDLWYGLIASVSNSSEGDWAPKWLSVLAENELKFNRAMSLLRRYSLVDVADQQPDSHAVHAVLHAWCHHLTIVDEHRSFLRLAAMMIAQAVPAKSETTYWTLQRRLLPHGMYVYTKMTISQGQHDLEPHDETEVPAWADWGLGLLFACQIRLVEAERIYIRALTGYEKALGAEHSETLGTVNNLGLLYFDQGKLAEAEAMYTRALAGYEKALGAEHTTTLMTVNNLGLLYYRQGKLAEAEAMCTRALAGYEKALGAEHTSTLMTVNNLGGLYVRQGKLAEAEAMYTRALAGYEKALGAEHLDTLMTVNNVGMLYSDQGKLAEAEAMYKRALAGYEKALGAEHSNTLSTVNNLGGLHYRQGKLAEAKAMYTRVLAGYEKALGAEHTNTLVTVNNVGMLYSDQGKLAEAEAMYKRALAGFEKALGAEHTSTLVTVNNLGALYAEQGRLAEAEAMYTRALAGYEKALGAEHSDTLNAADDLGTLYRKRHYICVHAIKRSRIHASTLLPNEDTSTGFIIAIARLWMKYGQARAELLDHLGHMLLLVGNLQDAAISFEQRIIRDQDGLFHSNIVCHGCDIRIRLPNIRYVCRSCEDVNLCPKCHQIYELEGRLDNHVPACQDHEFLAIPRDGRSIVSSGAVLTDGTGAKRWILRFLASLDESRSTASSSKQDQGSKYHWADRLEKVVLNRYVMGYRTRQDVEVYGEEEGWCCFRPAHCLEKDEGLVEGDRFEERCFGGGER